MDDGAILKRFWRFSRRVLLGAALLIGLLFAGGGLYRLWLYPYGWSHCCDVGLVMGLERYALEHDGHFPSGEATPEASLSLLYPKWAGADLLRGKTVPKAVVAAILERGERLGPESCGWHYVEGLTTNDDHRIAIFWDKVGLGHNGQRLPQGGHYVTYLNGTSAYIPAAEWSSFIEEQETLLRKRNAKLHPPTKVPEK